MATVKDKVMPDKNHKLMRPPRLLPEMEPPGYFGENYIDSQPLRRHEPLVDFEVFFNKSITVTLDRDHTSIAKIFTGHPEFKKLIDGKEHRYIGMRKSEDRKDKENVKHIFYIYVYSGNYTVEIHLDKSLKKVTEVKKTLEQPAPVADEIREVIEIARNDKNVASFINNEMVGQAILLNCTNPQDEHFGKRLFDVQFGNAELRLPTYQVIVDISTKSIISAKEIQQPKQLKEGGIS